MQGKKSNKYRYGMRYYKVIWGYLSRAYVVACEIAFTMCWYLMQIDWVICAFSFRPVKCVMLLWKFTPCSIGHNGVRDNRMFNSLTDLSFPYEWAAVHCIVCVYSNCIAAMVKACAVFNKSCMLLLKNIQWGWIENPCKHQSAKFYK